MAVQVGVQCIFEALSTLESKASIQGLKLWCSMTARTQAVFEQQV